MESPSRIYTVGDVIRMPNYKTKGGYRVWKIIGCYLGGENQEGSYELYPLDMNCGENIQVPCIILESHPNIVRV